MLEDVLDERLAEKITFKYNELWTARENVQGGITTGLCQVFKTELNEEGFSEKVDANLDLIGSKNGVYDLIGYDYVPAVNEYTMDVLALALDGRNCNATVLFWTGISNKQTGSNGKSTECNLLSEAFGDYYCSGKATLISGKNRTVSVCKSSDV